MSLDQANLEPTAFYSINCCAGFQSLSVVVLVLLLARSLNYYFFPLCAFLHNNGNSFNTEFWWHELFFSSLTWTKRWFHSISVPLRYCRVFSKRSAHTATPSRAFVSGLCRERMTTPLFILMLPLELCATSCGVQFGNKFHERYVDVFSQDIIDYYCKLGNWTSNSGVWRLFCYPPGCPAQWRWVPPRSAWGRLKFCNLWQIVTVLHEKVCPSITVLHFTSVIPPIHLHWRFASAKNREVTLHSQHAARISRSKSLAFATPVLFLLTSSSVWRYS